jgi:hypothetical protein
MHGINLYSPCICAKILPMIQFKLTITVLINKNASRKEA